MSTRATEFILGHYPESYNIFNFYFHSYALGLFNTIKAVIV